MSIQIAIEAAQRKVDAIDKRIDAIQAEVIRRNAPFDEMSSGGWHRAFENIPGLRGIEHSLYLRRADAADVRDALLAKQARIDERRTAREFRKQPTRQPCPTCGALTARAS